MEASLLVEDFLSSSARPRPVLKEAPGRSIPSGIPVSDPPVNATNLSALDRSNAADCFPT